MHYNQFLLSILLTEILRPFSELEYDLLWDIVPTIYKDYEDSKWNKQEKSEYDCIVDYIHNEKPSKFLEL